MLPTAHYRGRLAPSPTGLLHLGHARTFRVAADRAQAAGGSLVLRNEDLDSRRSKPIFARAMVEDLYWLGIDWAEGVERGGPYSPYAQSERRPGYLAAWRELAQKGWAYPCSCSRRELRQSVEAPHEGWQDPGVPSVDDEPLYPGKCRPQAGPPKYAIPESPTGINWRFRVPDGAEICFEDGAFGKRGYVAGRDFGDFLLWSRDDVPAYQLAVTVDDAAMRITEVVRGADLLKSTARQLLVYEALGLRAPEWFHCPLVTDGAGRRLAKRSDALSIRAFREAGRSPAEVLAMAGLI